MWSKNNRYFQISWVYLYRVRHLTFFFQLVFISWTVTLTSCLICKIIRLAEDVDFGKNNHFFRWSSFWSWRVCKQAKLLHLGHRKAARIHWKANASKMSHCLVPILVQRHNWVIFLRKWARRVCYSQWRSLSGHVERIFVHKNWREGYWQHLVLTGRSYVPHSVFCALFLKIALSATELMSFGHLGAAIWHRWTNICGVPSKISVTPTSQRQLTL